MQHVLGVGLRDIERVGVATGQAVELDPRQLPAVHVVGHLHRTNTPGARLDLREDLERGEHLQAPGMDCDRPRLGIRALEGIDDANARYMTNQLAGGREPHRAGPDHQHLIRRGHDVLLCCGALRGLVRLGCVHR